MKNAVAALALAAYLLIARGVGSLYPFSTFPMYAGPSAPAVARVMARREGKYLEVKDLSAWRCDKLPHLSNGACGDARSLDYLDREAESWIRSHPGEGAPIELVRRVFSFDGNSREDCVIARCSAR